MISEVLGYISATKIGGVIPLDLVVHFFVGMVWTILGIRKGIDFKYVVLGLILVAALKELNDYAFHHPTGWQEYTSDFLITLLYVTLLIMARKSKQKIKDKYTVEKFNIYSD